MTDSNKSLTVAVCPTGNGQHRRAASLAQKLALPLAPCESEGYGCLLVCTAAGLHLRFTGKNPPGPLMVNFSSPAMQYRLKHGGGRRQALARAVGLKKGWQPAVIDATAGLGRDAFILAALGCHVHMLEKAPVLAALLEDGLQRAARSEATAEIIQQRLRFTQADSLDFLQNLQAEAYPDVIFIDPMFPERTKSSLVKKEMRILRSLSGADENGPEILVVSLRRARNRVVVKRPRLAPPLLDRHEPSHRIMGKSSRFDVYLV